MADAKPLTNDTQITVAKPQFSNIRSLPSRTSTTFRNPRDRCRSPNLSASSARRYTRIHFRLLSTSVAEFSTLNIDALNATKFSAARQTWHRIEDGIDLDRRTKKNQPRRKRPLNASRSSQTVQKPALRTTAKMVPSLQPWKARRDRAVRSETVRDSLCAKSATKRSDVKPTLGNI